VYALQDALPEVPGQRVVVRNQPTLIAMRQMDPNNGGLELQGLQNNPRRLALWCIVRAQLMR
jgi:hypothetical protein